VEEKDHAAKEGKIGMMCGRAQEMAFVHVANGMGQDGRMVCWST
jgi:hypothetical protein